MSSSLRALLAGIVDYAGLFPPAKLPLDQALSHYVRYRQSGDAWMLGRFVVPAARLGELAALEAILDTGPPFVFSVLSRGGNTGDEFFEGLRADLTAISEFRERQPGRVEVDVLEVKLPDDLVQPNKFQAASLMLVQATELMEELDAPALSPYFEMAFGSNWRQTLSTTLSLLKHLQQFESSRPQGPLQRCRPAGFKLRSGGLEAKAFPTPEQVAAVIVGCRERHLSWKATAGLHHPVRRFDAGVQTQMHGFINVFGGAVLAATHGLDERLLAMILADEEAGHFHFNDEGFGWAKLWASVEQIRTARQQFAIAFGSCSFDEPREELRALGWLD
jgi:hypothetical protein